MRKIHATAVVGDHVELGDKVEIGPYAIIQDHVELGDKVIVYPHAHISSGSQIGEGTQIHMGAVIGHLPQDRGFDPRTPSFVKIGKNNIFREYAQVHRSKKENGVTQIGDNNYFMSCSHVAHDCILGDNITFCPNAIAGGHVEIQDHAFLSGHVAIHQFVRLGKHCFIQGLTKISKDVPPFMIAAEQINMIAGYNVVGLRRAGYSADELRQVKQIYSVLYYSDRSLAYRIKQLSLLEGEHVEFVREFINASERGICSLSRKMLRKNATNSS